jgi:hypothetical protein
MANQGKHDNLLWRAQSWRPPHLRSEGKSQRHEIALSRFFYAVVSVIIYAFMTYGAKSEERRVDVALVLAVDHSASVSLAQWQQQIRGYAAAFRSEVVLASIESGFHQSIAVTMFRWAARHQQFELVPWTIIDSRRGAESFAKAIEAQTHLSALGETCLAWALIHSGTIIEKAPDADRLIVDISGDESNRCKDRLNTLEARDRLVNASIQINGLPILEERRESSYSSASASTRDVVHYYREAVIGGRGAFLVEVRGMDEFAQAVQRKLVLEISALQ